MFINLRNFLAFCFLLGGGYFLYHKKSNQNKTDQKNVLIVGTCADFAPFTFVENGKIKGFDIDLINEIATRLDKKIVIKNMPFGTLLPSLQLGSIQVIAAGLTATEERAKHVLFTTPYIENDPLVIISRAENPINTLEQLHNKTVVVNKGYTADTYISEQSGIDVLRLQTPAEAFLALTTKRADALVAALKSTHIFFENHSKSDFYITEIPNALENASFAISPKFYELYKSIQTVLDSIKSDGTLVALKKKWKL